MVMQEEEMAARWGLISCRLREFCIRFWARCMSTCWNWNGRMGKWDWGIGNGLYNMLKDIPYSA